MFVTLILLFNKKYTYVTYFYKNVLIVFTFNFNYTSDQILRLKCEITTFDTHISKL